MPPSLLNITNPIGFYVRRFSLLLFTFVSSVFFGSLVSRLLPPLFRSFLHSLAGPLSTAGLLHSFKLFKLKSANLNTPKETSHRFTNDKNPLLKRIENWLPGNCAISVFIS